MTRTQFGATRTICCLPHRALHFGNVPIRSLMKNAQNYSLHPRQSIVAPDYDAGSRWYSCSTSNLDEGGQVF
jgi:hypothetical protein